MKSEAAGKAKKRALEILEKARIIITPEEAENMEVAELGLDDIESVGVEVILYENNDRYCAKELILLPRQICPEHRHPSLETGSVGKQETFRCRWGEVYLYVAGEPTAHPQAVVPEKYLPYLTVWKEVVLRPGDQFTLPPDTLHWFQAGNEGAVMSEFSSTSTDGRDIFTDPRIRRTESD
jgi:D-lyxose ketol-isomerase